MDGNVVVRANGVLLRGLTEVTINDEECTNVSAFTCTICNGRYRANTIAKKLAFNGRNDVGVVIILEV